MNLKNKIKQLPHTPGVYRFINDKGEVIYIGKAKDLKKRVSQYFTQNSDKRRKTAVMVSKIADISHIVVESEEDALLLENNLIKEYQPKYNLMLKDDKTYPWICVKNEDFPRVHSSRRIEKDGSLYFGPYGSASHAHDIVDLANTLYKLRTCRLNLNPKDIEKGKFRTCLKYHLKRCYAPCIGKISKEQYDRDIEEVINILKGRSPELIRKFKESMKEASARMNYEEAQEYKEKLEILEGHYSKSLVVNQKITNTDVFYILTDNDDMFGNFMRLKDGAIINSFNIHYTIKIEEERSSLLSKFIMEIISRFGELSKEIIVPFKPDDDFKGVVVTVPLRGDKEALLKLSCKNATAMKYEKLKNEELTNYDEYRDRVLTTLMKDLEMSATPYHIECFDNSNLQGTNPVSSCVVFIDGKPCKKEYRHFNVKTIVGANDFATMKEVVNRRYSRMIEEKRSLPQLIVIDGGRGQVNFAFEALTELGIQDKVTVIGIAKRLEELIRPGDPYPIFLDKNSTSLKLLMSLRDEAHRFGITHHRNRRSRSQISSQLREIPNIGEKTEIKLMKRYKTISAIKKAEYKEVAALIGKKAATSLFNYYDLTIP